MNLDNQNMIAETYDTRRCELGEGVLWHPLRKQLFWFDILNKKLLSRNGDQPLSWDFDECVSAAGWVDRDTLLVASETGLFRFDLQSGSRQLLCAIESDNPSTRSNDGRADPFGGFWIGTMSKTEEARAGAIYRYYKGELHPIHTKVSIPNSICFSPEGDTAYFSDTPSGTIMRQPLDCEGWPSGAAEVFVDLQSEGLYPDGSVVDGDGGLWNAQWGAGRVARYLPDGNFDVAIRTGCPQSTCPAFGGDDLSTLYIVSAYTDLDDEADIDHSQQGVTFSMNTGFTGRPEPQVIIE